MFRVTVAPAIAVPLTALRRWPVTVPVPERLKAKERFNVAWAVELTVTVAALPVKPGPTK